jgi:DNA-directed RNA polymerase subunit RPC12/RpoP
VSGVAGTIVCVECGGLARLLQPVGPDDDLEPGDTVAYRCTECRDRFDLVVEEDDLEDRDHGTGE